MLQILLEAPARRSLWGDMWILDSRPLGSPFVSRFWVLMPTCLIPVTRIFQKAREYNGTTVETACNSKAPSPRTLVACTTVRRIGLFRQSGDCHLMHSD
ncbi:hypothetical protein BDQ94DRAFT_134175 [Aspergillus welwitschiae]|uniref:Uncharacterized protein n=1 Tax=Aspergillus welwitschiae TaxID=1341132 RepID=A0A3F3QI02_9EURO|nr:hypothetical protein BDQ94DRAFT_134175 [Aspergillus welwitschiae]RDH38569.1 hypothetical protein BDQ94DRAFT_134175 [Aspergillus welwitschiae]